MNWQAVPAVLKVAVPLAIGGVLAGAIALGATSGGNNDGAPQAAAATPTPVPEANATAVPLGPRTDCPAGWSYYLDPAGRFSFCYPPQLELIIDDASSKANPAAFGVGAIVRHPVTKENTNRVLLEFAWMKVGNSSISPDNICPGMLGGAVTTNLTAEVIASRSLRVCEQEGFADPLRKDVVLRTISFEFPVTDGGVIFVQASYTGPFLEETRNDATTILDTLKVR